MGEFTKNTTITFLTRILSLIIGLATSIIIARILGPNGKGIYSLVILLPTLIVNFTNIGIGPATVYYIGKGKYPYKEIFGNNVIMSLIVGGFSIFIGLIIIIFSQDLFFSGISRHYLLFSLTLIPFSLFFAYTNSILLGLQRFKDYNLFSFIKTIFFLIMVVITLLIFKMNVFGVLLSNVLTSIVVSLLLFVLVRGIIGGNYFRIKRDYIKDISTYGIKAHLSNILSFLHLRLDMLLINVFMNPLAVGYYSISVTITEKLWLVSQSASTVLFPKVSSEKDEKMLKEFTPIVSRNVLLITGLGAILIFFLSRWIVILLFSEAYLPAVEPLQILLIGTVAVSGGRVLGNDIAGRGRPILNTYLNTLTVVVNLCLDVLWIPKFGIAGAAWATTISYSVALIGSLLVYSKISGNSITKIIFIQKSDIALYRNIFSSLAKRVMGVL